MSCSCPGLFILLCSPGLSSPLWMYPTVALATSKVFAISPIALCCLFQFLDDGLLDLHWDVIGLHSCSFSQTAVCQLGQFYYALKTDTCNGCRKIVVIISNNHTITDFVIAQIFSGLNYISETHQGKVQIVYQKVMEAKRVRGDGKMVKSAGEQQACSNRTKAKNRWNSKWEQRLGRYRWYDTMDSLAEDKW